MARRPYTASALLAEDVRPEFGNKHTVIGTYSGDILLNTLPAQFKIALYATLKFKEPGHYECRLRLSYQGEKVAEALSVADTKLANESVVLVLPSGLMNVSEPGPFAVEISVNGASWDRIAAADIRLSDDPSLFPPH